MSGRRAGAQRGDVRSRASGVLEAVLRSKSPARGLLDAARVSLPSRDRRLLDELTLGALRWLRRLDRAIELAGRRPIRKIDREILAPLRIAAYQLLFLDRIPSYAAVDSAVGEVRRRSHRGAAGFANAILRRLAERREPDDWLGETLDSIDRLALETSYPTALVARWVDRFGESSARAALEAGNRRRPYQLLCVGDRSRVAEALASEGIETVPLDLAPFALEVVSGDPRAAEAFGSGLFYIQDLASQAAARVPPPRAGERILDVAAAPGGKSFSLLTAEPGVRLVAFDVSLARLLTLRANRRRLSLDIPLAVARAEEPAFAGRFDRVVADLPCSGTGTFARHPELKWRISDSELERLSADGLEILLAQADAVAPEGLLCALTCSVEAEENEEVVERFLERRPDFEIQPVDGADFWRLLPAEQHDGFTVHVLRRR